jgi:glycosyltransferase involved in cell wall biosynthesis
VGGKQVKLSVVIPCLNAADVIAIQFEALANQQWSESWEVIVSDNGSVDDLMQVVKRYEGRLPYLRIVDASDKRGQAHARNVGVKRASGEAIVFCDADDEVAPGWLTAMGKALSQWDFVACRIDMNKLNPSWLAKGVRHPQVSGLQPKGGRFYLPHAGGSTLGVKRWVHDAVGGFDETLALCEDTDYCWSIQLKGVELHFVPDAVVHVRLRDTIIGNYRQAVGWGEYRVFLYKKYLAFGMPKRTLREGITSSKNFMLRLIKSIAQMRNKSDLVVLVRRCGTKIGYAKGSIKYRVAAF